jgi:hypothetical protein
MKLQMQSHVQRQVDVQSKPHWLRPWIIAISLGVWFIILCFVANPRPLSAPAMLIAKIQSLSGYPEPVSRTIASLSLRVAAFGLLGVLTTACLGRLSPMVALSLGLLLAPALAVFSQRVNFGYFPIASQLQVSIPSAIVGALIGLTLRRGRFAPLVLLAAVAVVIGLFLWGTSTHVSSDLDFVSRQTAQHILANAKEIRSGNDGFADAVHLAFLYAEDNSHNCDPVQNNKAAILALGMIFGDDTIAKLAHSELAPEWRQPIDALRQGVTLRNRLDTPRHYCVSAALVITADEGRAMTIGLSKELLDANPGGSGFSFVDLAANRAGILLALAATRDEASARATQMMIVQGSLQAEDYCPKIEDLPEGLTLEQFQSVYGGLGGELTGLLRKEIDRRMATKPILRGNQ